MDRIMKPWMMRGGHTCMIGAFVRKCAYIVAQDRGITLRQLLAVWNHAKTYCVKERWHSTYDRSPLEPDKITLYDLNAYVIKPATAKSRMSFVELVSEDGMTEVVRCPDSHLYMTKVNSTKKSYMYDDGWRAAVAVDSGDWPAARVRCDGCGVNDLEEHFQCVRCDYKYCGACADKAKIAVPRSSLQCPEFFVSHWYNSRL